jgi:hypothetical protein
VYYVRCNTRSSGASAKGTPSQALEYITGAHDAERDPSYSHAELAYIARLDPGWKSDLEGGRIPLVGLGALRGCTDQAALARDFEQACQPYHDRRGSTGYLSYTFTMPKELSLVAEGHPIKSRQAMYAALQATLDRAFAGKEYRAVAAVHARNEAGEVHYHAHVLIGKFARDTARQRVFSLNSRSGGNTGKLRLRTLKEAWKDALDAELKQRLGLTVRQGSAYGRPALTLADGTHIPALNRESRRMLDKHLCFRLSETTPSGATKTRNFRWTHFDPTIYELASSRSAMGWSSSAFCELFPELASRLRTYESRAATLERVGYLTPEGRVTDAFTLHYRAHKGDHPELQRLRADLHKFTRARGKPARRGPGDSGASPAPRPLSGQPVPVRSRDDENVDLWLALHRHQHFIKRLERLGVSPAEFRKIDEEARRRSRPTPEMLKQLRRTAERDALLTTDQSRLPRTKSVIRSYCAVQKSQVVSFFVLAKGLLTLNPRRHAALAARMRQRARIDYFYAKERRLGQVARRLRPLFWIGRIIMPREIDRLELALRRCNDLAVQLSAVAIFREQRARLYRNSRDALTARLRAEVRVSNRQMRPDIGPEERVVQERLARSEAALASRTVDPRAIAQLRAGLQVLRTHLPQVYAELAPWQGREPELATAVLADRQGPSTTPRSRVHEAAMLAGWLGCLLEREHATPRTPIPKHLEPHAHEIVVANARLRAAGIKPLFAGEILTALPVHALVRALDTLRHEGLLGPGHAWTLRARSVFPISEEVRSSMERDLERDKEAGR